MICLIGNWKKSLDQKKIVGAVIKGLSKAFDSIAKICVYGFSIDVAALFYLYLKRRKQNVRIIYTHSAFAILLLGVPKVQYLGHFYSTTVLINFAHDNIIRAAECTIEKLIISTLEQDSQAAID